MRYLIILTSLLICCISSCRSKKISDSKTNSKIEKISLSERTRGTFSTYTFSNGKLETSLNGKNSLEQMAENSWLKISAAAEEISLESISTFEAPSTKNYSDAALASTITIYRDGKEFHSNTFDSGNPPAELRSLYDEIKNLTGTKKSR